MDTEELEVRTPGRSVYLTLLVSGWVGMSGFGDVWRGRCVTLLKGGLFASDDFFD